MIRHWVGYVVAFVVLVSMIQVASAQRSWDDNGNDPSKEWSVANNWSPDGVPSEEAVSIGDLFQAASDTTLVDQDFKITSLAVSLGADVDTSGNRLEVNGGTLVSGSGSSIFVDPRSAGDQVGFDSRGIDLLSGGLLSLLGMAGSTAGGIVELESGMLNINAGTSVGGHGAIQLIEAAPAVPGIVMQNSGTLFVTGRPDLLPSQRLPGTLTITRAGTGTGTIDLDGTTGDGIVDVDDSGIPLVNDTSLTLVIEVPLFENFSGQMDIGNGDTVNIVNPWEMNAGGSLPAVLNLNGIGTHTLTGGALTVGGATTQVNLNAGTAVFQSNLTFNDGQFTLANNTTVNFSSLATFDDATDITNGASAILQINDVVSIGGAAVAAGEDFDWDGDPLGFSQTVVGGTGTLNINVENLDNDGSDTFDGGIQLSFGNIDVQVADGAWVMEGNLNINTSVSDSAVISGDSIHIGNDADALSADLNVAGTGIARITSAVVFESDADVNIAAGPILQTEAPVNFNSVNGANNAEFTGAGTWRLAGTNTVSEATTINMTGGTVDLDNSSVTATVANDTSVDAPLTINVATMADYGSRKGIGMFQTFSELTIDHQKAGATGSLTVNLDDPNGEWTINSFGIVNLVNDNTPATLLAGSDINLDGTLNVTGDVRTDARLDIGATGVININTPGEPFRLGGGNISDPNTIAGGTISGPGVLGADEGMFSGTALWGFGTINTDIDFDGDSRLFAVDGILTVSGDILDASQVGASDDGVLNVTHAWNNSTVDFVFLHDGEVRGGTITNDAPDGIRGYGLVSARVINNENIFAPLIAGNPPGTLVVETAANDNDWDGTTNSGALGAANGSTLEIRDNAQFPFSGNVLAFNSGIVFTNGFALRFDAGSGLDLRNGTYRSTHQTLISGIVFVDLGGGTIEISGGSGAVFSSISSTTLNGDLHLGRFGGGGLFSLHLVHAGATFTGSGKLVNLDLSLLQLNDGANVGVAIENRGNIGINGGPGQATMAGFAQTSEGRLAIGLSGTAAGDFDQFVVSGGAQLDGELMAELFDGFVPSLGNSFTFLSAAGGVSGTFATVIQPAAMPAAGLMFSPVYNPTNVQLVVTEFSPGDYNLNGVVDAADVVIWRNIALGTVVHPYSGADGNGDGIVNNDDYNVWRAHFGQTSGSGTSLGTGSTSGFDAVPEPAPCNLLLLSLVALGRLRWSHVP